MERLPNCSLDRCSALMVLQDQYTCEYCKLLYCGSHIHSFHHHCVKKEEKEEVEKIEVVEHPKCGYRRCTEKMNLSNRYTCRECEQMFCLAHRHDFSHMCKKK